MLEFFAIFSFSYIVFLNVALFVFIIYSKRKAKKQLKDMGDFVVGLRGFGKDIRGNSDEI